MERANVLLVDDEQKIRDVVRIYLEKEGFFVGEAADGQEALEKISSSQWDLVVLDLMMPGIDGWAVCSEIRKTSSLPIIILTARDEEVDRIVGLELGADDYVVKPFSPRELAARVKAVLRRTRDARQDTGAAGQAALSFPGLSIDPESRLVLVEGHSVNLTPKEYDLLYHLAKSPKRTFTREELLSTVWGYDYFGDARTVDTHINRLRDKLAKISGHTSFVATVWGVGYKFEARK